MIRNQIILAAVMSLVIRLHAFAEEMEMRGWVELVNPHNKEDSSAYDRFCGKFRLQPLNGSRNKCSEPRSLNTGKQFTVTFSSQEEKEECESVKWEIAEDVPVENYVLFPLETSVREPPHFVFGRLDPFVRDYAAKQVGTQLTNTDCIGAKKLIQQFDSICRLPSISSEVRNHAWAWFLKDVLSSQSASCEADNTEFDRRLLLKEYREASAALPQPDNHKLVADALATWTVYAGEKFFPHPKKGQLGGVLPTCSIADLSSKPQKYHIKAEAIAAFKEDLEDVWLKLKDLRGAVENHITDDALLKETMGPASGKQKLHSPVTPKKAPASPHAITTDEFLNSEVLKIKLNLLQALINAYDGEFKRRGRK